LQKIKKIKMNKKALIIFALLFITTILAVNAQCPGCVTNMGFTVSPAAPAITPDTLPNGTTGQYYDEDINFYLPAQFTHSSGTNVTLTKLEVLSVSGLPFGLSFQSSSANNTFFPSQNPPTTEHGCAKVCGTPVFPGQFNMVVFVRAYVNTIIGSQTSDDSFVIPITILPGSSGSASFSVINSTGCGSVTSSFQTNLPSNGHSGYSYAWYFGNGSNSTSENPSDVVYNTPGQYNVTCQTTIDTLSFNYLNSVTVLGTSCTDFLGKPDLYLKIKNQSGSILHQTACILDTDPPVSFTLPGIQLFHNQTYSIEVWDEDGGLAGSDDHCKTFQVPGTSQSGSLWSGSDGISFVTNRPFLTFNDTVTVTVYPQPSQPVITPNPALNACVNDSILLSATQADNYQWHNDTTVLLGANNQALYVYNSGKYFVVVTDNNGCQAQSDTTFLTFYNNPPKPTFWRQGDTLKTLLDGFNLQWYHDGTAINGATSQTCFIFAAGNYHLVATTTQGCSNISDVVFYQPFNNSLEEAQSISNFMLYPNPNNGQFKMSFEANTTEKISIILYDLLGKQVYFEELYGYTGLFEKELTVKIRPSLYIFELNVNGQSIKREKVIVQ